MSHVITRTAVSSSLIGKPAPDAVLPKTDGTSAGVISSAKGQKAIVIFWATWCPHCYEELGTLRNGLPALEGQGIKIILVDLGETKQAVMDYLNKRRLKLVSFVDEDGALQAPYRLAGIPTVVFIDENGIVRNLTHQFPPDYQKYFS